MLNQGDRVLVAVSGGPDSVCLLHVLHALAKELDLSLHVAHLDHMFRGQESADEALFVADLAKKLGVPATIEHVDVPAFCLERGLSSQEGARDIRYRFFHRVADETDADRIATGHTANDQAETFLMRLIRGAGVSGLSSIPPVRENIIRPLINATREEVLEHLRAISQEFKTDPSNATLVYTRNRIRLEVLPMLRRFNPRIVETLADEANLLRDENEAVNAYLDAIAETAFVHENDVVSVKRDVLESLPPAFQRRLLRKVTGLICGDPVALSQERIDAALAFMDTAQTGRTMNLIHDLAVTREYNRFIFSRKDAAVGFTHMLVAPGLTILPLHGWEIEAELVNSAQDSYAGGNYLWQATFDYDKIASPLSFRSRHAGDWFSPAGMDGKHKKLQDYFVDEKVPQRKRNSIPLLCSGEDILWVVGMRTDERFLAGPDTLKRLLVTVRSS